MIRPTSPTFIHKCMQGRKSCNGAFKSPVCSSLLVCRRIVKNTCLPTAFTEYFLKPMETFRSRVLKRRETFSRRWQELIYGRFMANKTREHFIS